MKVVLDTNIVLDYFIAIRPNHKKAFAAINQSIKNNYGLYFPSSSLASFFYIANLYMRKLIKEHITAFPNYNHKPLIEKPAKTAKRATWGILENLLEITTIIGQDSADVLIAQKLSNIHDDFEDNLVIAAAERSNADYLITEDKDLLLHSSVPTLTTGDFLKITS